MQQLQIVTRLQLRCCMIVSALLQNYYKFLHACIVNVAISHVSPPMIAPLQLP